MLFPAAPSKVNFTVVNYKLMESTILHSELDEAKMRRTYGAISLESFLVSFDTSPFHGYFERKIKF